MTEDIEEIVEDEEKAQKLEKLIEKKVDEKLGNKNMEEARDNNASDEDEEKVTRRKFLKKLGVGAAGFSALSILPASALDIRSSTGLTTYADGNNYFNVNTGGPVEVVNTDLQVPDGQISEQGNRIATRTWAASQTDLDNHTTNTSNPHSVTASQVGSYTTSEADSNFVDISGDTMNGNLGLDTNNITANGGTLYDHANGILYANIPNASGGGITISDDGGFYDYNDGWIRFEGSGRGIDLSNSDRFKLPHRSSDPGAGVGDMWYRTDLD